MNFSKNRFGLKVTSILVTIVFAALVFVFAAVSAKSFQENSYLGAYESQSTLGVYTEAAIASDAPYCAKYGKQMLKNGGTAMDAAIATLLCMGVVLPQSMGLGGGCFIVHYDASTKNAYVIDGREEAPMAATEHMFDGNASLAEEGPLTIGVPGELHAYWTSHKLFGRLPWKNLFEGAIEIAGNGFVVHESLAHALNVKQKMINTWNLRDVFVNKNTGEVYKKGEIMKRPDLRKTLKMLSQLNPNDIKGALKVFSKTMAKELKSFGSIINEMDFNNYKPSIYEAFQANLDDLTLYSTSPPGSGILLAFIMKLMFQYKDLYPNAKFSEEKSTLYYHRLIETFKHAYSRRALLGDPRFDDIRDVVKNLTSDEYMNEILAKIVDNKTFPSSYYGDVLMKSDKGTAHCSVVDSFGNAVAVTSSINGYFGSGIMSPSTGIIFNNQMDDFSSPNITNEYGVPPTKFNHVAPGKKPMSSMCPAVFANRETGLPVLAIGGAGGTMITTGAAFVALRALKFQETIKQAIDAPRLHHQLYPPQVQYEHSFPTNILEGLKKIGHELYDIKGRKAVITAIHSPKANIITANTDYRKSGEVDGITRAMDDSMIMK